MKMRLLVSIVLAVFLTCSCGNEENQTKVNESTENTSSAAIQEENVTESSIEGSNTIDCDQEIKDINNNSAESALSQSIGKTYSVLKKEHPNAVIQNINLGGAGAECLVDSEINYSYYFFGTQDFPFENYAEKYKDQFKCSGIYTTAGVYFPMTNDMLITDFFSGIGVTDYDYYTGDNPDGWGWFRFKYKELEVNLDGSKDSFDDNDNFKPLTSIKRSYPVFISDPNIEDQNQKLIEGIYKEQNYSY